MSAPAERRRVPDILDCLAQLSNDEVPTPPRLANAMLDLLPAEVWSDPTLRWLDPCAKSGVFLREVARRLLDGLAEWEPDFEARRDHVFRSMVFGTSITALTGELSRRSLYYSTDASGDSSVVRFEDPAGNVPFVRAKHDFDASGKCRTCRAPVGLVRDGRENYAYSFIHDTTTPGVHEMKFDVIVGNPPYQIGVEGNSRAKPIYHFFIERAIELNPRYVLFITPSRWFSGGLGLDDFRARMLSSSHFREIVDHSDASECFPGVEIKGGVSYFLWDSLHEGATRITNKRSGEEDSVAVRRINEHDVLVRSNEAISIVSKVMSRSEDTLRDVVSPQKPFGLQSNYHGSTTATPLRTTPLYGNKRVTFISSDEVTMNREWIGSHKVLISEGYNGGDSIPHQVTGRPFVIEPRTACTQTYLVAGKFSTRIEAENYAAYLSTRFVRFLISLRKITQHCKPDTFAFVPDLTMKRLWTDSELYERYGFTTEEVSYIESQVKEISSNSKVVE